MENTSEKQTLPEPVELTDEEIEAVSGGGSLCGYTDMLNNHSNEFNKRSLSFRHPRPPGLLR